MKRTALALLVALITSFSSAEILTIYSDAGFPTADVFAGGVGATFDGEFTGITPPEGYKSFRTLCPNWFFWGYAYPTAQNLSRFNIGELRFWVNSSNGGAKIEIKNSADATIRAWTLNAVGWTPAQSGQWALIRIPLTGVPLSDVKVPFVISQETPNTIYVDQIRYIDSTAAVTFQPVIKNRVTHAVEGELSWSVPTLPVAGNWVGSNHYIEMTTDVNMPAWGVQIYTDNRGSGASPAYTGAANTNPAGLVDMTDTKRALPLAWTIRGNLSTSVTPADPNANVNWMYMKDATTPNIAGVTSPLVNGEYYVVTRNNVGIHYGVSDPAGPDNTPDYIFLEADFAQAVTPRTYRTNRLILELFVP